MDLRLALLLIGIVIVTIVALSALDRARLRHQFRQIAGVIKPRLPTTAGTEALSGLDINPSPPPLDRRRLKPEEAAAVPRPARLDRTDPFLEELESLEEVATMPLRLELPALGARADPGRPAYPDERIDFILHLSDGEPVARDRALGLFKQNEYHLEKPRKLYGRRHGSELWSELERDPADTRYDDLALAIQMVDRRGPLDESELNTFSQVGLVLADTLQRRTRFSMGFEEVLERAQVLHRFCEAHDVIAGVNVVAEEGGRFTGRAVELAARKLGLKFGPLNIFHMKNDLSPGCRHLFSMANLYAPGEFDPEGWDRFETRGLALFMSVPCAHHPVQVFEKMMATALGLCEALGGRLQDQDGRPLTARGIALIRGQIEAIESAMRDFGVTPGGETALRLFGDNPTI